MDSTAAAGHEGRAANQPAKSTQQTEPASTTEPAGEIPILVQSLIALAIENLEGT